MGPERRRARGRWPALGAAAALLVVVGAAPAVAQETTAERIRLEVTVTHISDEPGPVDTRASRLHTTLSAQFRYQSLAVMETKTLRLSVNEAGSVSLPGGRTLSLKPLLRDGRGALLAVDLPGVMQADVRVRSGQLVVLGAQRYRDGKLVISLEPTF